MPENALAISATVFWWKSFSRLQCSGVKWEGGVPPWMICLNIYASFQEQVRCSLFCDMIWVLGFWDNKSVVMSLNLLLSLEWLLKYHIWRASRISFSTRALRISYSNHMISNIMFHWPQEALNSLLYSSITVQSIM